MVENVLELLDDENEFYNDRANELLYWAPNASTSSKEAAAAPPAADALIAVRGKVLLSVTGSQQQPARPARSQSSPSASVQRALLNAAGQSWVHPIALPQEHV